MRRIDLSHPADAPSLRLARLTGHLEARLLDFGPGGPEVLRCDPGLGVIDARFPGRDTPQVLEGLQALGVSAVLAGDTARFYLDPQGRFEDLDYLWGCLFQLL